MSKDYTKELKEMERLMNYGMNESKKSTDSKGIIEYSQMGADGKTYGILREGTKYFVKVAPKKDTKIVAEDYDYVGGFLNRKGYDSYTKASNALNLQLISVNESNDNKKPVESQYKLNESAEWQNTQTKEAREELNRFYQIVGNVDSLLNENVHYIKEDKDAPFIDKPSTKDGGGTNGPQGKQQNLGIKDKTYVHDGKQVNPETVYNDKGVKGNSPSGKYEAACGDHDVDEDGGNAYQEKAKASKEQGKTVANESKKHVVKLSEEQKKQVLAWRDDRAFVHQSSDSELDRSHGTEIGDTAPYDDKVNVNENFETSEWDEGLPNGAGIGDPKDYKEPFDKQDGVRQPVTEQIFEIEMDPMGDDDFDDSIAQSGQDILDSDLEADDSAIYDHLNNYGEGADSLGVDFDEDPLADLPATDTTSMDNESNPMLNETVLDDFGKHPAYQKKVMSLPPNADGSKWGRDWNDDSTKGEQPYGKQIGHSGDPFEDVVNTITNAVVTALAKKKD